MTALAFSVIARRSGHWRPPLFERGLLPSALGLDRGSGILVPIVFYLTAVWRYPISEARHQRLIGFLERRKVRREAAIVGRT